jgi:hypothetical protein
MTPIIVAAALAAVIVIGACLVLVSRSRRDDEGEQFRRVADLTSRWSRQVAERPSSISGGVSLAEPKSKSKSAAESESESAAGRAVIRTTESVDPS